jgi:chaperonin GroEL
METILTGAEARSKLLVGVNKLANSIKGTLGPNARTVVIQNPMGGMPVIINDGVSIARMVNDKDPYVQMGIDLLKEVASEAQQKSGDGTTSATLIAQTLCNGSLTLMENGTSPLVIRDALKSYLAATEEYVRESAIEDFDLKDVATIAANNDGELGELIAGVVKRGQGITIERSPTNETYVKRASGFEMNAGYAHALMANAPRAKCEFDNPMVLTTTEKISTFNALVPALEAAVKQNKPLVIFCSDFNGQMLQNLLVNIVQGKVSVCMIKPAGMPEQQQAWLEDVAAATGAKLFKVSLNESIVNITSDDLGSCEKFVSSQTNTILSIKETDELGEYIDELTQLEDEAENDWLAEQYHNRAKRLGKGISTIYVGGASEIEETKERVDDAVNACKLALSSGVVIGGGATLYGAANELDEQGDVADLFRDALKTPLRTIISNTGDEPNLGLVLSGENYVCGKTAEVRNAIEDGVLDPMQVVLNSLESAVSIASLVLMTDAAIIAPSD